MRGYKKVMSWLKFCFKSRTVCSSCNKVMYNCLINQLAHSPGLEFKKIWRVIGDTPASFLCQTQPSVEFAHLLMSRFSVLIDYNIVSINKTPTPDRHLVALTHPGDISLFSNTKTKGESIDFSTKVSSKQKS